MAGGTAQDLARAARLSVAPMLDWSDRHCRYFHRLLSREALLYTEMIVAAALVRGGATHLLRFDPAEYPVAVQLGGSDPAELAEAARIAEAAGYDEINLNLGCPSDRVQSGCFGAVLMKDPALAAACAAAMREAVGVPVTVKCRIGVDEQDPEAVLPDFLARMRDVGIGRVTIHARKAWLQGLSPKENREIPPLDYPLVQAMKRRFPDLHLSVNGGVASLDAARAFLDAGLDGVMIGRAAYHAPAAILQNADAAIWGGTPGPSAEAAALAMMPYVEAHVAEGGKAHAVTRHMLGLFAGRPGARVWRRHLTEAAALPGAGAAIIAEALERMAGPALEAAE